MMPQETGPSKSLNIQIKGTSWVVTQKLKIVPVNSVVVNIYLLSYLFAKSSLNFKYTTFHLERPIIEHLIGHKLSVVVI